MRGRWLAWLVVGALGLALAACGRSTSATPLTGLAPTPVQAAAAPASPGPTVAPTRPAAATATRPATRAPAPTLAPSATPTETITPTASPTPTLTPSPPPTATPSPTPGGPEGTVSGTAVRIAVIGDYGLAVSAEGDVANLVKSWQPDLVITTGDNNYPAGSAETIDHNIGQFYSEFIHPYVGEYGPGADRNRFFPTLGNHDWMDPGAKAYLDYFALPGNERYYDIAWGPVHLFALDSMPGEPDGITASSKQAAWLREGLARATEPWKLVYMHHPPFSSGPHGSTAALQWPYARWGATAVLAGHDHIYERIERDGIVYFVNGLGGSVRYAIGRPVRGSQVRYADDFGAMLIEATWQRMTFQFINRRGEVIDTHAVGR